jgi:AP2-associated kinase
VDIWMLGCITFMLVFMQHPFEEQGKLAIVNASYTLPVGSKHKDSKLIELIRRLLTPDPRLRPNASDIIKLLHQLDGNSFGQPHENSRIKLEGAEWGDYQ